MHTVMNIISILLYKYIYFYANMCSNMQFKSPFALFMIYLRFLYILDMLDMIR